MVSLGGANRARWGLLALALVLGAGCRCRGRASSEGRDVERMLGRGAVVVVVVPKLAALGGKLAGLEALGLVRFVAPSQGFADAHALGDALVGELGVDVRSPRALEAAGLDGDGPAAVSVQLSGAAYLALPVRDPRKLHGALAELARRRLGAPAQREQVTSQGTVTLFARSEKEPPRLGYLLAHGFALVAVDEGIDAVAALAALPEGDSLAQEPALASAKRRVGTQGDAYAYLPPGSPLLARAPFESALAALTLESTEMVLHVDAPWKPGTSLAAALERQAGAVDLGALLPADAFMAVRWNGRVASLAPLWRRLAPWVDAAMVERSSELLGHVRPGLVAALALAERPPLGRGMPELDVRATNPFAFLALEGVASLDDADAGVRALEEVARLAPKVGAAMERVERSGASVWRTSYALGEGVHVAVKGERASFGSPFARLERRLGDWVGDGGPAAMPLVGDATLVARFELPRLTESVRALPESAWGLGGFAVKATALRWLDALSDLRAVVLEASSSEGVARGRLSLSLTPPRVEPR